MRDTPPVPMFLGPPLLLSSALSPPPPPVHCLLNPLPPTRPQVRSPVFGTPIPTSRPGLTPCQVRSPTRSAARPGLFFFPSLYARPGLEEASALFSTLRTPQSCLPQVPNSSGLFSRNSRFVFFTRARKSALLSRSVGDCLLV